MTESGKRFSARFFFLVGGEKTILDFGGNRPLYYNDGSVIMFAVHVFSRDNYNNILYGPCNRGGFFFFLKEFLRHCANRIIIPLPSVV